MKYRRIVSAFFAAVTLSFLLVTSVAHALTKDDIINMSNIGVADSVIISAIKASGTVFKLTANDIIELTRSGVSQTVIEALQQTATSTEGQRAPSSGNGGTATPPARGAPPPERVTPSNPTTTRSEPRNRRETKPPERTRAPERTRPPQLTRPGQVTPLPADVKQLKRRYDTGKYTSAVAMAFDLLTGPNKNRYTDVRSTIFYYFGKSLYKLGYYNSAHDLFLTVAQDGPSGPHFNGCLSLLTRTSDILKDFNGFSEVLVRGETSPEDLPRRVRSTLLYLIGLKRNERQDFEDARRALDGVSINSEFYARAQFLEGTAAYRQGDSRRAVQTFRALVEANQLVGRGEDIKDIKDLSLLNMARIYYKVEDFERAELLYDLVPHDSNYWPQALFEAGYTNFWQGDYNIALGQLLTLKSPFFKDRYYLPEADLLQALIFYNLCEYDRVLEIVDQFKAQYTPVRDSIREFVQAHDLVLQKTEQDFEADSRAVRLSYEAYSSLFDKRSRHSGPLLPPEILVALEGQRDFRNLHHHLRMIQKELAEINEGKARWKGTALGNTLSKKLEKDATKLRAQAGRHLLEKLSEVAKGLSSLLGQADIIRFEVLNSQKEEYEDKFRNPEHVETYEELAQSYATESTFIYWPFTGEFWKDELGYYRFTERGACRSKGGSTP